VQPLATGALARATGTRAEALFPLVRDLQADRLVRSRRDGDALAIEPYHDQVRRAVIGGMSPERQRHHHRGIAEALEIATTSASEALAAHWLAAGDPARARPHAVSAGHRARAVLAFDRAATFYRSAIDLHADPAEVPGALHRWHAEALAHAGRAGESAVAYEAATARTTGHERSDLARLAAEHRLRAGDLDAGLVAVDRILASHGMSRPRSTAAAARMLVQEKVLEACAPAMRRLFPLGRRGAAAMARKADVCWTTWLGLSAFEPLASAVSLARFVRISRRLGDPKRLALALCLRAPMGALAGPPARSTRRALAEVRALIGDHPEPLLDGYHTLAESVVSYLLGDFVQSLEHGERALLAFRRCSAPVDFELAMAQRYVLNALWHTGRVAPLRERTLAAWREADRRGDRYLTAELETTVLPTVHLADDDVEGATAALDRALTRWPRLPLSLINWQQATFRTAVALYAGRPDEALRLMEALLTTPEHRLFSRVAQLRVCTLFAHASALLGVAAAAGAEPRRQGPSARTERRALLRRAERMARGLERTGMGDDFAALVRGQISLLGDREPRAAAEGLFARAEDLFARRGLRLLSLVATYGVGIAMGGNAGRRRVEEVAARLRAETVRNPERVVRAYAPSLAVGA
jgi:hypothetical protein